MHLKLLQCVSKAFPKHSSFRCTQHSQRAMSSNKDQGIPVEGLPKGPEIQEHHQEGQPGIQEEMNVKPELTRLPTSHGGNKPLTLEEYTGVGKLKGRVAIITGADSGIGLSAAIMFAREKVRGITVVHHPKEQKDADVAKSMLEKEGAETIFIAQDLREGQSVCKNIVDKTMKKWGHIDILINNAAHQPVVHSVTDVNEADLKMTFETNIYPMFYLAKYAVPHMKPGSSIIQTSSVVACRC